jgi:succinate dehydrogenase / fumarate reductase iron-sulfur subunit
MNLTLIIWRQESKQTQGKFETYSLEGVSPNSSFLEMLDLLNEQLISQGLEAIAFDHDCREGICGSCSLVINGIAHGPQGSTTTCQLHMRHFNDGDTLHIEPWRAAAFPVVKDLVTDRSAFDRLIQAGGYVSVGSAGVPDANTIPISKHAADIAMDAAACIGCGACAAACKNSSAMLFVSAKVSQLANLPQGQQERDKRVLKLVKKMGEEGFGHCSNTLECEAVCPKNISVEFIAQLNRDYIAASFRYAEEL